jgi:hypothetical protein
MPLGAAISCVAHNHLVSDELRAGSGSESLGSRGGQPPSPESVVGKHHIAPATRYTLVRTTLTTKFTASV